MELAARAAGRRLAPAARRIGPVLHLAHSEAETSGEEWMTVAYLRDTADQAGLNTVGMTMEQIGFDHDLRRFVDHEGRVIQTCFKLYPWEDMLTDEFGERVLADPQSTRWIEPLWKVLLSNKALLAALWHLYPGHENLLPAYLDRPWGMTSWIAKPLHGREGDGMKWVLDGTEHQSPHQHYGAEGHCYQLWSPPAPSTGRTRCSGRGWSTATRPGSASASPTGRSPTTTPASCRTTSTRRPPERTSARPGSRRTGSSPRIPAHVGQPAGTRSSTSASASGC